MKYDIIVALTPYELVDRVNEKTHDGWVPIGGPFYRSYSEWYQAMIKMEEGLK